MKFPSHLLVGLAICLLASWPACSTDMAGLGPTPTMDGTGGGSLAASGGRNADGSGGADLGGTGSAAAGGATAASGGDSGTGGDDGSGSGGSGGDRGTGGDTGSGGATGSGGGFGSGGHVGTGGAATGGRVGTGGAASGGRFGGAATGGAGTGGRWGTGGLPGSGGVMGTGGAIIGKPECVTAADCRLENDCCACRAVPTSDPPPACALFCQQTKCAEQDLPPGKVDCVAGRCVAGFTCDTSSIVCGQATPGCPLGMVPSLSGNRNCFSNNCVLATQCLSVDSCASCGGPNQACVSEPPKDGNTARHCVTIPQVCQGTATCGCFGPSTCVAPNTVCSNLSGVKGVACAPR